MHGFWCPCGGGGSGTPLRRILRGILCARVDLTTKFLVGSFVSNREEAYRSGFVPHHIVSFAT